MKTFSFMGNRPVRTSCQRKRLLKTTSSSIHSLYTHVFILCSVVMITRFSLTTYRIKTVSEAEETHPSTYEKTDF